ncbi:MAG: maltose ABC transporter substrate-binding protein [Microbacterium sp.]|uniref:sugar ABC transporter substrate-binding protein n=1 Tax=Microbacterium sp. TaxID=51671 RepID=UPI001ACB2B7D|nr:maltose ABC transporter substrate-binding protein [Microbacterium sp.]MBN9153556.1 maltose ABC transporter substrate-binding protein [Microbacterium sp.]MBN9190276.1 maltose ABC transporter substrate-binding protein [Microbacterium sp.]MBN9195497.1 maltose ABC transporter substrate-binding protein [Microbacterium sp.]
MKVNKKGAVAIAALIAGSMLALAGCSGSGSSTPTNSGSGKLTVWVDADRARVLKDVAAQFKKDKGITVDLVVKDYGKIQQDFTAQVPTGKGPDLTIGGHDWTGGFVQDGVIAPVELGDKASDFEKVALQAVTYDGKTYGLPYAIENIAILRNTALADSTPATWDEMIAKGKAAGKKYPFLVGLDPQAADPYHLYPLQTSFGNSVFAQNSDGTYDASKLTIGDTAGQAFAKWVSSQGDKGTKVLNLNLSGDLAKEAFLAGESPYYLTGPWNVADAQAKGIKLAVDPIPSAGGKTAAPFAGVQTFFLSSKSKNALAATDFLVNYVATEKVQTALYKVGGRPPALTTAYQAAQSDPIVAGFGKVGENAVPMPSIPQMGSVWDDWGKTEAAIIKGADPTSSWTTMATNIQAKLK